MSVRTIYRGIVLSLLFLQLAWFFFPWDIAYHSGAKGALLWLGANAVIKSPDFISIYSNALTIVYVTSYIGLFFFIPIFRPVFMILVVIGGLAIPLFGLSVESGYEAMLGYFMTIGDGIVLSMIYSTTLADSFNKGLYEN